MGTGNLLLSYGSRVSNSGCQDLEGNSSAQVDQFSISKCPEFGCTSSWKDKVRIFFCFLILSFLFVVRSLFNNKMASNSDFQVNENVIMIFMLDCLSI